MHKYIIVYMRDADWISNYETEAVNKQNAVYKFYMSTEHKKILNIIRLDEE